MLKRIHALGLLGLMIVPAARGQSVAVGVARVDITPDYPVRLHGYASRQEESRGVQQRIWVKALALGSDEQRPVVIVTVDNLGIPDAVTEELAQRLRDKAGIARERLVVGASHTHSAPMVKGLAPNIFGKPIPPEHQARIDRYTAELTDQLERVALTALAERRPGTLAWGQGRVGFAVNRRLVRAANQVQFGENPQAPVDHDLPMLRVADLDGTLRAVLVNYACHCTTLDPADNLISGDWAGYAQEAIEADHPGCTALTLIGCGGDANPANRTSLEAAQRHGRALADEVKRLLAGPLTPLPAPPIGRFRRVRVPLDTLPTREQLEALVQAGGYAGYNAQTQLARLERGEPLQDALDYPVQTLQFGDRLIMVFLAGEVVVDYALRLKRELDAARLWVTAYANDVPCYIASERILEEGGYEGGGAMVFYAKPARLKPGVEEIIIAAVRAIVPPEFNARPQEPRTSALLPDAMPPPLPPEQSLAAITTKPGLKVELVAAEPLVVDPVAIDFGGDGKLWVCEMHDYPTGLKGNYEPGGRIQVLDDNDGDGRFDRATLFLDGLPFPTGLMCWRKGVLVCAAPRILYAEDTDGDGRADLQKVLYDGFATENYQARVNGLSYGLDNWVYGANGLIGGRIQGTITGRTVDLGGRDFRFRPDSGQMEPASGLTQQGRVRDDWGNWFGNSNSVLLQHYPFPDHAAVRNPYVPSPAPAVYVPRNPDSALLFPTSRLLARFNHPESANRVTSACSPAIYRDDLLGAAYAGNAFVCEPVHNLVTRQVLAADGVTFAGDRAPDERASEFLCSTDNWFRPVQVRTGPDGGLWVVDMYRLVIEHPRWISPDRLATLDVRAGSDRGRIYRILPATAPPRTVPVLDRLQTSALAAALESPNGTQRDNVQRLLVHRSDKAAVPVLERLARTSRLAVVRMQALCTLEGLRAITPDLLQAALSDVDPGVRRQAARLSEPLLKNHPALGAKLVEVASDGDLRVRFQAALSLGEWDHPEAGRALGRLAVSDGRDPWVRAAVLSSAVKQTTVILETVLRAVGPDGAPPAELIGPLLATAGSRPETAAAAIAAVTAPDATGGFASWKLAALADLLDAATRGRAAATMTPSDPQHIRPLLEAARRRVADESLDAADRAVAVRLLGRELATLDADLARLGQVLGPRAPTALRAAALRTLARIPDDRAARVLVAAWRTLEPSQRGAALDALLARSSWTLVLLDEGLGTSGIAVSEIDPTHRQRLLHHADASVRKRAASYLAAGPASRQAVLDAFARVRSLTGDPSRGAAVFDKLCATCHLVAGKGHAVGPDLEALTDTTPEALVLAILDPNRDVDARYAAYTAALADGRVLTGLIAAETGSAITLKQPDGREEVVLRSELEELRGTGQSLMPEGLERDLTPETLADLIAFLVVGGSPPKSFTGNHPEVVAAGADGVVRLEAATAAIRGDTLAFEPEHRNLGSWHSANDRASWIFTTAQPATYTVTMEWACADEAAGETYIATVGSRVFQGTVGGTGAGTWQNYRSLFLFETTLPAGRHRLEIRPTGKPKSALLDLRTITLIPRR